MSLQIARLLPQILSRQGASPLHEGENAELRLEVNKLRPLARCSARQRHRILRGGRVIWQIHGVQEAEAALALRASSSLNIY